MIGLDSQIAAMDKEIVDLELTNTWTLTTLPPGKVPTSCKWIYRTKYKSDGSIDRHKARFITLTPFLLLLSQFWSEWSCLWLL